MWLLLRTVCLASALSLIVAACDTTGQWDGEIALSMDNTSVSSKAGSEFVTVLCSTDWTLSIDFKGEEEWASLSRTSGKGNTYSASLSYNDNAEESDRVLELVLKAGNKEERLSFTQYAFVQGGSGGGDGDKPELKPDAVPGWMELPAQTSGLDYYNHHFMLNGRRVRNYSLGWDGDSRLAHWVAYPLCSMYLGSQKRTDEWNYDPKVPESEQPVLFGSYKHSDLDRGHQLPSNDRTCNRDANVQTFYFSNMTPQVGKQLNQSIWGKLELKVNSISRTADTLYVVTGCIVDGSTRYVNDSGGNSCIVPTGYFKALLYYGKSNTLGTAGYSGAAFYLENRSYSETAVNRSHCMSIDELEEMTGLDFFVNLPDAIEAIVEKEDPSNIPIWW